MRFESRYLDRNARPNSDSEDEEKKQIDVDDRDTDCCERKEYAHKSCDYNGRHISIGYLCSIHLDQVLPEFFSAKQAVKRWLGTGRLV